MKLLAAPFLMLALFLNGCGQCVPASAYTIPAHWDRAYYSTDSIFDHWGYVNYCGYRTYYSYSHRYYSRYSCNTSSYPVYRNVQTHHAAVYHAAQYVPEVTCPK